MAGQFTPAATRAAEAVYMRMRDGYEPHPNVRDMLAAIIDRETGLAEMTVTLQAIYEMVVDGVDEQELLDAIEKSMAKLKGIE